MRSKNRGLFTRFGDTSGVATVAYATNDGTASERTDYTTALGTLRFATGEVEKTFTIFITDDAFIEGAETVNLILSNPTGASLGTTAAATLTINSEDSTPPTPKTNPINDPQFFVRQHYRDFLNRDPDAAGLAFWTNQTTGCGDPNPLVCRINVSAAFYLSIEFQETGYLVYRFYKAAYGDATSPGVTGTVPAVRRQEFLPDTQQIGQGVRVGIGDWAQQLEQNKQAYALDFVRRQRFLAAYPLSLTPAQFVNGLNQKAGNVLTAAERDQLVAGLVANNTDGGRAAVLRQVAEDEDLKRSEFNRAFVLMQYYGYLRRNPDDPQDIDFGGWKFWLDKLNQFGGNFIQAEMVRAFIESIEYRQRFGQ